MIRKLLPAAGALLLAAAALGVGSASAQSDALFSGFEPSGGWQLAIDGQDQVRAEIYELSRNTPAILVISGQLSTPLLIDVSDGQVSALQMLKVYKRADGRVDLLADAVLQPVAKIQIVGTEARFSLDKKPIVLKSSPHLLGVQKGTALLDSNFGYRWRAKTYEPDASALGRLKNERREVRVLTYFGTWCPHCSRNLPSLLKVEQKLTDAKIKFDYYGLPQQDMKSEPEAAKSGVDSVPTAIVFVGGKEVGRIPAAGWNAPELALDLILRPDKASG